MHRLAGHFGAAALVGVVAMLVDPGVPQVRALEPPAPTRSAPPSDPVDRAEQARIAVIERVAPGVVCLFDEKQRGGGSGVLIDAEGHGLTNYHVVAGLLATRRGWGGLSDGTLYPLEVLGIDPTGDVAMFRMLDPHPFPFATLGDSDAVRVGDSAIAMGNPFVLSEDYTPSVTLGIVTGVHRYQWGVGGNLAYTDCIQVDASINPGSSGGPLFNADGEIIGINGRISVNARGRFNVGFGYAISSKQIRRFLPSLRAGLIARHGTLQATVRMDEAGRVVFDNVPAESPAYAAGARVGDRLISFDGSPLSSANHFASLLGAYPTDWPVPLEIERGGARFDAVARLVPVDPKRLPPFTPDRDVNLRAVRKVLEAHQRPTVADPASPRPKAWKYTLVRQFAAAPHGDVRPSECYEASFDGGDSIHMQRRYDDGSPGPLLVFNDQSATQRIGDVDESLALPADARMILATLYLCQCRLHDPGADLGLTNVVHSGADALVRRRAIGDGVESRGAEIASRLLEVIDWPLGDGAVARLSFDTETGRLLRARVRDIPTDLEVTLEFSDHRDVGGMVQPCTIEVRGLGYDYRDELSSWEVER